MKTFKDYLSLAEASLDVHHLVGDHLRKMGYSPRIEHGGKHDAVVYDLKNGKGPRKFMVSHGKKGDGNIRHAIVSSLKRHVAQHEAG